VLEGIEDEVTAGFTSRDRTALKKLLTRLLERLETK